MAVYDAGTDEDGPGIETENRERNLLHVIAERIVNGQVGGKCHFAHAALWVVPPPLRIVADVVVASLADAAGHVVQFQQMPHLPVDEVICAGAIAVEVQTTESGGPVRRLLP